MIATPVIGHYGVATTTFSRAPARIGPQTFAPVAADGAALARPRSLARAYARNAADQRWRWNPDLEPLWAVLATVGAPIANAHF